MNAPAATLSGMYRADERIELTGTLDTFRDIARRAHYTFRTIPYPSDALAGHDIRSPGGFLSWTLTKKPPETRFALITHAEFKTKGLEHFVEMQNDPLAPASSDAGKALSETLKALLLDRRDRLRLDQLADEMETRLGTKIDGQTLRDSLDGAHSPRSRTLNALLLVLHAHKPLTPGNLSTLTGQAGRELDPTLRHLLTLPHWRFKEAYYDRQIHIENNGEVTLAGLTVPPETAIVVLDEKRWPRPQESNQGQGNQGLGYYARSRKRNSGQGYDGRE